MTKARELADLIANVNNGSSLGSKNLIINGNCSVAQRGDQTGLSNAYCGVDRYTFITNSSARVTGKQNGSSVENGFANALHLDVTTADASAGSSDYAYVRQYIEGQNLQHLKWGTSSAKPLTLSFYVKSPKTGTHWVEIYSYDAAKFKSASYTVNSADTWEKKTLSFSGETGTAIADDNTSGILVGWWLMAGTTYTSGTHGGDVWHTTHANRVPNQVNTMDNTSNNFYLTGVQLEIGEKVTAFEHEPYETTLRKASRYYTEISRADNNTAHLVGYVQTSAVERYSFHVPMRTAPSITETNFGVMHGGGSEEAITSVDDITQDEQFVSFRANVSANLTAGQAVVLYSNGAATLTFDAEL